MSEPTDQTQEAPAQPEGPTAEQRAEMEKAFQKMFRAQVAVDEDGEPVLAIALNCNGIFLMAGTLNRGMALSEQIRAELSGPDDQKKAEARATLSAAAAQVSAFTRGMTAFVEANSDMVSQIPGAKAAFETVLGAEVKATVDRLGGSNESDAVGDAEASQEE